MLRSFVLLRLYYAANYQFNGMAVLTFVISVQRYLLLVVVMRRNKTEGCSDLCTVAVGGLQVLAACTAS